MGSEMCIRDRLLNSVINEPLATFAGIVVIPTSHILIKSGATSYKTISRLLVYRSRLAVSDDETKGRNISRATNLGVRLWGLQKNSCVARSIVIWSLCSRAGIRAKVIVGYSSGSSAESHREFHAWVEVNGIAINDRIDVREVHDALDKPLLEPNSKYTP